MRDSAPACCSDLGRSSNSTSSRLQTSKSLKICDKLPRQTENTHLKTALARMSVKIARSSLRSWERRTKTWSGKSLWNRNLDWLSRSCTSGKSPGRVTYPLTLATSMLFPRASWEKSLNTSEVPENLRSKRRTYLLFTSKIELHKWSNDHNLKYFRLNLP